MRYRRTCVLKRLKRSGIQKKSLGQIKDFIFKYHHLEFLCIFEAMNNGVKRYYKSSPVVKKKLL